MGIGEYICQLQTVIQTIVYWHQLVQYRLLFICLWLSILVILLYVLDKHLFLSTNSLSFLLFLKGFLGQINDDQWIVFDKWTYLKSLLSNANTFVFLLEQINFQLYQSSINLSWMFLFQSYWNVNSRACRRKVEWQQTVLDSNYLYSKSYMHIGCRSCVYLTSNIVVVVVIIFVVVVVVTIVILAAAVSVVAVYVVAQFQVVLLSSCSFISCKQCLLWTHVWWKSKTQ